MQNLDPSIRLLQLVPLFADFSATELALIAELCRSEQYREGEVIYRQDRDSSALYMFASGRAVLLHTGEDDTVRLVRSIGPGDSAGEESLYLNQPRPDSLQIVKDAQVLVLYGHTLERFLTTHPEYKIQLNYLTDLNTRLTHIKRLPLFSEITQEADLVRLLDLFEVKFFEEGEYIYRQGERSAALYYFVEGRGMQLFVNEDGVERRGKWVNAGNYVGERSLFMLEPRPNSLVVARDALVLVLPQRKFDAFINNKDNAHIKMRLNVQRDVLRLAPERDFEWLSDGEQVLHFTRRHRWAFCRRTLWAIPLMVVFLPLPLLMLAAPFIPNAFAICGAIPLALAPLVTILYNYFDWRNDFYVVTNQRVVHEENILLAFNETRQQAPLTSIQMVNMEQNGYWAERFGFGDVIISTAGAGGAITFDTVADPEELVNLIYRHYRDDQALHKAEDRAKIRSKIDYFLGDKVLDKSRSEELPNPKMHYTPTGSTVSGEPYKTRWQRLWQWVARVLDIRTRYEEDTDGLSRITYRKHWIVLWNDVFPPTFFFFVWLGLLVINVGWYFAWPWNNIDPLIRIAAFAGSFLLIVSWWMWMYWDWHNDLYIIEGDFLRRIHRRPLWLQDQQSTIPISKIQGVDARIVGIWQRTFNYGTVVVQTAAEDTDGAGGEEGAGEILFQQVYKPRSLQEDIIRRQREERVEDRIEEMDESGEQIARWLAVYHQATNPGAFAEGNIPDDTGL